MMTSVKWDDQVPDKNKSMPLVERVFQLPKLWELHDVLTSEKFVVHSLHGSVQILSGQFVNLRLETQVGVSCILIGRRDVLQRVPYSPELDWAVVTIGLVSFTGLQNGVHTNLGNMGSHGIRIRAAMPARQT